MQPSSADRWSACPGSVTLSIGKRSKTERYSVEGTVAHALLAECLQFGLTPESSLGKSHTHEGFTVEIDQDMVDGVNAALSEINDLCAARPGWTWMIEHTVSSSKFPTRGDIDFGLLSPCRSKVVIFDFKYGAGVMVPTERNPQVMTYGVVLMESNPDLDDFTFVVVQPRARTGKTVKYWMAPGQTVREWAERMVEAAKSIQRAHETRAQIDPELLREGDHCRWCPAKVECPRLQGFAAKVIETPKSTIREFGSGECRDWLDRLDAIETWCSAVRGRAHQLLEEGEPITGWKLVASVGNRRWAKPTNEILDVLRDKGFPKNKLLTETLISPAQLEKFKLPGKISKDDCKALIESLVVRPPGERKLAKDDDSREEVQGNGVLDDFATPPTMTE